MSRSGAKYSFLSQSYSRLYGKAVVALIGIFLAFLTLRAGAQTSPQGSIEIEKGGSLWIEGTARIVDFKCYAQQLSGTGKIENPAEPQQNIRGHGDVSIKVRIPVHSLDCGKRAMNKDMYNALKADDFSAIQYQLLNASLLNSSTHPDSAGWMNIQTIGKLEIAGVTDTTTVIVKGKLLDGHLFRVRGSKDLSMKSFDIKPPTALMGIIKANDQLTVHFDVTVRLKDDWSQSQGLGQH